MDERRRLTGAGPGARQPKAIDDRRAALPCQAGLWRQIPWSARVPPDMGSLIKKRRKRMRKKKHKKMLKATRWQRRAAGK